jgi:hypothetical protein
MSTKKASYCPVKFLRGTIAFNGKGKITSPFIGVKKTLSDHLLVIIENLFQIWPKTANLLQFFSSKIDFLR